VARFECVPKQGPDLEPRTGSHERRLSQSPMKYTHTHTIYYARRLSREGQLLLITNTLPKDMPWSPSSPYKRTFTLCVLSSALPLRILVG